MVITKHKKWSDASSEAHGQLSILQSICGAQLEGRHRSMKEKRSPKQKFCSVILRKATGQETLKANEGPTCSVAKFIAEQRREIGQMLSPHTRLQSMRSRQDEESCRVT